MCVCVFVCLCVCASSVCVFVCLCFVCLCVCVLLCLCVSAGMKQILSGSNRSGQVFHIARRSLALPCD